MPKDAILVEFNTLTPDKLTEECKLRVKKGVELLEKDVASVLIMNGGHAFKNRMPDFSPIPGCPLQCDLMKDYAISLGTLESRILTQPHAAETVGEAYFVKEAILIPRNFRNNVVVSSMYHLPRLRTIYDHILGPGYTTEFEGAVTNLDNDPATLAAEKRSETIFLQQFGHITPGDSAGIEKTLYTVHGIYSKFPEHLKLRFHG